MRWKWLRILLPTTVVVGVGAGMWSFAITHPDTVPLPRVKFQDPVREEQAKESKPKEDERVYRLVTANDAALSAIADLETFPAFDRQFIRYLWLDGDILRNLKSASITVNVISRGTVILRLPLVNKMLARVDLRVYYSREKDLMDALKVWEKLQLDPNFNLLITKDELDFLPVKVKFPEVKITERRKVKKTITKPVARTRKEKKVWPGGKDDNGDYFPAGVEYEETIRYTEQVKEEVEVEEDVVVTKPSSEEVLRLEREDIPALPLLRKLSHSEAPIVHHLYFQQRALTTIKDVGVFKEVFGGLYYDFRGIRKSKEKGVTDLDLFLEDAGIGNVLGKLKFAQLFDRLRSDQRIGIFRSGVTGKPRQVVWFHGPDARDGTGTISITYDIRDQDVDVKTHPIFNLLDFKPKAFEVIRDGTNGTHVYALFGANEELLDRAAPDVAADRTIPAPHSTELQSALSCMSCHEVDGSDGWKPLANDVKKLLSGRLDVFGDQTQKDAFGPGTIDRLAGLYAGDFNKLVRRARDDYAETVLKASGAWPESKDQSDVVKVGVGHLIGNLHSWRYDSVDAKQALSELGVHAPAGKAAAIFTTLLPPDPQSRIGGIIPENPVLGALKQGLTVNRFEWELFKGFAGQRMVKTREKLIGEKP